MDIKKVIIIILIIANLVFPLFITQVTIRSAQYPYIFKARFIEKVDEVKEGLIQSYLVERIKGNLPEDKFIISLSKPWTKGYSRMDIKINQKLWMQGQLVKSEKDFYHRGYDSIMVNQIKGKILWPGVIPEIKELYFYSPMYLTFAPIGPFGAALGSSVNPINWIIGIILVLGTIIMLIINFIKRRGWNILLILLTFYLLSMIYYKFFQFIY